MVGQDRWAEVLARESWVGMRRMQQRHFDDCLRAILLATEQLLFLLVTLHNQDILISNGLCMSIYVSIY